MNGPVWNYFAGLLTVAASMRASSNRIGVCNGGNRRFYTMFSLQKSPGSAETKLCDASCPGTDISQ
jgi:hypothetical protein